MDDKEVDRLVKEAEANREADKLRKEAIEARNMADSSVYQAEKTLTDNKDKYDEKLGDEAREKIEALKKVLAESDATKESIDTATQDLQAVMMKVGQEIYSKAGPEGDKTPESGAADAKKDDGTVEAEVEEK
jgi:molecular chaperone DnaK